MKGSLEEADNRQNSAAPYSMFYDVVSICVFHLKNNSFMDKENYKFMHTFLK